MIGCVTQEGRDASNAVAVKAAAMPGRPMRADFQGELSPAHLAALRQSTEGAALASSYHEHGGAAAVQAIGASGASGEGNLRQFGPRRPSGDPAVIAGQAEHTAPAGAGAEFRVNARREGRGVPALQGVVPHSGMVQADVRAAMVPAEAMRARGGAR